MHLCGAWAAAGNVVSVPPVSPGSFIRPLRQNCELSFPFCCPLSNAPRRVFMVRARKRGSRADPVLKPTIDKRVFVEDETEILPDEVLDDDEEFLENDDFDDEYMTEDAELYVGDGGGGGGISLAGTSWDKEALAIAENVSLSLDGDLKIYAFKTLGNGTIQVRIEKMSNKSGSPSMSDIETFSSIYREQLDEAELAGTVPENLSLEVSSPGVERVVRIPLDLDRFKDRPMYVKYRSEVANDGSFIEQDGIFRLISFNLETSFCSWGIADVRVNREKAGKGRPLSKKQRQWQLDTPFDSLCLVRLYSDA